MPKSETNNTLMLQCSFTSPHTGKKCLNHSENKSYCSLHLILKLDNKNIDINDQQTKLEDKTNFLIERTKRLQSKQLCEHINKQLSAFVKYEQEQMNFTCQHPQFINRDHFLFDKNFVLSTLQSQTNISQEDKQKLSSNFKNLPTSQLVKLIKKLEQDNQNNQAISNQLHSQQQPNCLQNNNNLHNLPQQPVLINNNELEQPLKNVNSESPTKQPLQINNPVSNTNHDFNIKVEEPSPINSVISFKDENNKNRKSSSSSLTTPNNTTPTLNTSNKLNNSNIVVNRKPLAPKFTSDQIKQIHTTTGILHTNLRHLEHSYDSDATESSSGGESCDELDDYLNDLCKQQKLELNSITPLPLNQKSNWKWALERGSIASRWTWLQAQVADLDFKIRQQNELYKQFRTSKGPISFYSNESNRTDDNESPCIRTLPLKEMKKRKQLVRSVFTLANARKPTVLCSCSSLPAFSNSCVLCNDRYSYIQAIDTDCMPISERVALLDASYHSVLSLPENVSLGLHFSKLLKKETVHRPVLKNTINKKKKICSKGELSLKFKNDLSKKKKSQAFIQSTKLKKKYEGNNKKQLFNKKANKVRLNSRQTVNRSDNLNYADDHSRHDSPLPFENGSGSMISSTAASNLAFKRRRSEATNAYDINNIVIPYSIASTTRVERLKYKEIITPEWRITEDFEELNRNLMEVDKTEPQEQQLNNSNIKSPVSNKLSPIKQQSNKSPSALNKLLLNKSSSPDKMDVHKSSSINSLCNEEQLNNSNDLNNQLNQLDNELNNSTTDLNNDNDYKNKNNNSIKLEDENSNLSSSSTDISERKSDSLEDLSDEIFIERHLKCEADEKKRFSSYLKNPLGVSSRGRIRQRTESTKSESINLESNAIDGSSQDSFSNMQINCNNSTPTMITKAKSPDCMVLFQEEGSNQSTTNKTRSYSLSSRRDDLSMDEENQVEVIPYEKRNFPLNDNEFHQLTMYSDR